MNTKMLKNLLLAGVLAASTLLCAGQGVTYTSRSAFNFAIAGLQGSRRDVNFEGALPPGGIDTGIGIRYFEPLTVSGLTFWGQVLLVRNTINGRILNNYDSFTPLRVDMNGSSRAFGADFASLLSPVLTSFTATVSLDNGGSFTFTAPANPNLVFFGFVTSQPFSSVTFSDGAVFGNGIHEEILDNITAVVVPEPGVFALFASGALLLGWHLVIRKA